MVFVRSRLLQDFMLPKQKPLKVSEWALRPLDSGRWWDKIHAALRMVVVSVPLQLMLALPFSDWDSDSEMAYTYTEFQGFHCDNQCQI